MYLLMADVGFEPLRMQQRRLALRCTSSLPTALPRLPQKGQKIKGQGHLSVRFWFQSNAARYYRVVESCFGNKFAASGVNNA